MEIYEHNVKAYEKVKKRFLVTDRTCVIHATGTGKSFIAAQLVRDMADSCGIYITSYLEIMNQFAETCFAIGADASNLTSCIYTNLDKHTSPDDPTEYRYIILDEFHRAGAELWGKAVKELLRKNPHAKVLGLSATPIRQLDGKRDMSEELFHGDIASELSLTEAIEQGILPTPVYIPCAYDLSNAMLLIENSVGKLSKAKKRLGESYARKAKQCITDGLGIEKIVQTVLKKGCKYILFCSNEKQMKQIKSDMSRWTDGEFKEFTVLSSMRNKESHEQLELFKAYKDSAILYCIDMLNEGVHVKDVEGVIMFRTTTSWNVYSQQLGRALSSGSGKNPVILDIVANIDNFINEQLFLDYVGVVRSTGIGPGPYTELHNFKVIKQLRDFNEIMAKVDNLARFRSFDEWNALLLMYKKEHGNMDVPGKYVTKEGCELGKYAIRVRYEYAKGTFPVEKAKILEMEGFDFAYDSTAEKWKRCYGAAMEYFKKYGDLEATQGYVTSDGFALGTWLAHQRILRKNGKLSGDRIARLDKLNMRWTDYADAKWMKNYNSYIRFVREGKADKELSAWMTRQRMNRDKLSEKQKEMLIKAGFKFKTIAEQRDINNRYLVEQAPKLAEQFLFLSAVPQHYVDENGKNVGNWIKDIISGKREISAEDRTELVKYGLLVPNEKNMADFIHGYREAEKYYKEHGNIKVSAKYKTEDDYCLGRFIQKQRTKMNRGELSEAKMELFEKLGGL